MSRRKKRGNKQAVEYVDPELNIMPFIDIFSMLNVFLLFSAVFISIGIIEVQVPFLSNAKPPEDDKPARLIEIVVEIERQKIILVTRYTAPPVNEQNEEFGVDANGLNELHAKLIELRTTNPDTDLVQVFIEDDVTYENLTKVLDSIKIRRDGDPQFTYKDKTTGEDLPSAFIYEKVVLASVGL